MIAAIFAFAGFVSSLGGAPWRGAPFFAVFWRAMEKNMEIICEDY